MFETEKVKIQVMKNLALAPLRVVKKSVEYQYSSES